MFKELLAIFMGFFVSLLSLPFIMERLRKAGFVGVDVHKKTRPIVPEMGGIAIILGLTVSNLTLALIRPEGSIIYFSFLATVLSAGVIGAIDDLRPLNARLKPILTALAGLPILILQTYKPHLVFPIIGGTRLTIVYPLLVPIAIAVSSNAVNMMDPFNGTMSGTCSIVTIFLLASASILGRGDAVTLCASLLGPLLAFYYFNRYPSRVFSGDVGSLSVGAALGAIAIIGRLEAVAVVAFMPQIMNAFYGLSTIGRLYERREVPRPITKLDDGRLIAKADPKAPLTLARLILARGALHEYEVVLVFISLSIISGVLALITAYLMVLTP